MPDCMSFPDNIMDFIDDYSFEDSDHVYTNGSKLIQSFRVKQAVEHYFRDQEPVKPVKEQIFSSIYGWVCGACSFPLLSDRYTYCPRCGKEVKWDD